MHHTSRSKCTESFIVLRVLVWLALARAGDEAGRGRCGEWSPFGVLEFWHSDTSTINQHTNTQKLQR